MSMLLMTSLRPRLRTQPSASCSNKDETEVQYAFNGITTPMGVASYDNVKRLQEQLPSVEELKARIRLLEKELEKNRG